MFLFGLGRGANTHGLQRKQMRVRRQGATKISLLIFVRRRRTKYSRRQVNHWLSHNFKTPRN